MVYRQAYPGIDLKFYGNGRQLEYDIIVRPGADPAKVKFSCQGVRGLKVTPAGDLALKLPGGGELVQKKPLIYQEIGGQRQVREGRFQVQQARDGYVYGFTLAAYDPRHPLVIDPVLSYSTYLGGSDNDYGYAIAVDGDGCAYVTGETGSFDFPTQNPYQGDQGAGDAFVTKLSAAGNALEYSTYLGGNSSDYGWAIAVDGAGCAYVTGSTSSSNFPTENPYQENYGGGYYDAFVAKISDVLQVSIDIKPGEEPNCFNQNEHGVIPVAILGSADLDVDEIDVESLMLQGLKLKVAGKSDKSLSHTEYINTDEHLDLVVQFEDSEDWAPGDDIAKLTGELLDGTAIEGTDSICIVP